MYTFIQTSNTQRENENTIFTSEKLDKSNALAETLKGFTINNAGYYESESANANDLKVDPVSDPKTFIHTSDRKKRKVTDTSSRYFQKNMLIKWTLLINITMMDPRIYNRDATCGESPHKLVTHLTTEVITNTKLSSAQFLWTPRHVSRTGRYITAPGNTAHAVMCPWDNSPVLIGGIGVPPIIGHSGILQVFDF